MTSSKNPGDVLVAELVEWAEKYPSSRFVVISVSPDEEDAVILGWGLANQDYMFASLPSVNVEARFTRPEQLTTILGPTLDARIAWIDPEPDRP